MDKSAFIEGFVKRAVELGYEDDAIESLFKLAMADPNAGQMFHDVNQAVAPPQMPMQHPAIPYLKQMLMNPQQAPQLQQLLSR